MSDSLKILEKYKSKTTDPHKILSKILHACSNEVDTILGKTSRNAPLEPEEVRKLKTLSEIVTGAISTQIALDKHETSTAEEGPGLVVTVQDIKALTEAAKKTRHGD